MTVNPSLIIIHPLKYIISQQWPKAKENSSTQIARKLKMSWLGASPKTITIAKMRTSIPMPARNNKKPGRSTRTSSMPSIKMNSTMLQIQVNIRNKG